MAAHDYEIEAARRLPQILADAFELAPESIHIERQVGRAHADLVIHLNSAPRLVAEVRGEARSVDVERAGGAAKAGASELDGVPLVVVPYMGEAGKRVAREIAVGWIDLSGNASLRAGDLVLQIEGRPNRYARPGRPSSPFSPVSARVTRLMLFDPSRWWRQAELAFAADMRDGQVSKVVRRLIEMELVERGQNRAVRPPNPDRLLEAWANDYDFKKHTIVHAHMSGSGPGLARNLAQELRQANVEFSLTGLPAAWLRDRFAQFRLVSVYVEKDPVAVGDQLEVRFEERGANVQFVLPNDPGVLAGSEAVDAVRCVSPVQNYLDLLGLPERAAEAAEYLRAEHLGWSRGG